MPKPKAKMGRPPKAENRTRTRNLVIRLSDAERAMLDVLAPWLDVPNATEVIRHLVTKAHKAMLSRQQRDKYPATKPARSYGVQR